VSGNILFVSNASGDTIGEYDATTGAAINANFITGLTEPFGIAVSGNNLFVLNAGNNTIGEYDATTGAVINAQLISVSNGLRALTVAPTPTVTLGVVNLPTVAIQWNIAGAGDFNGDGDAGLVWENTITGQRAIWFLKNGVPSSALNLPTVATQWRIAGVGDFQ
jgi:hypothetical protein